MPRRKKAVIETTPIVTGNYWDDVLIKLGYRLPYLPLEQLELQPTQQASQTPTSSSMHDEMRIFAERLIYALCPPDKGYASKIVQEVKSIYDVLEGRKDFDEWFRNVRQMLSLKPYQLAAVIYQCLEGLKSKEAKELKDQWYSYLQTELKGYGLL
jgi:hypothetical protein